MQVWQIIEFKGNKNIVLRIDWDYIHHIDIEYDPEFQEIIIHKTILKDLLDN